MLWWDSQSDYASFLPKMWDQIEEVAPAAHLQPVPSGRG